MGRQRFNLGCVTSQLSVVSIFARLSIVLFVTWTCTGCARSEPPGVAGPPKLHAVGVSSTASASSADPIDASTNPADLGPQLFDESGEPKPQTEAMPVSGDPSFQARVGSLCTAIIEGKPEKAHSAFFPIVAYRQVKAIADPDRDYATRLLRHFDRDIVEYSHRIAKRRAPIRCAGIRIPRAQARWMKPGSEYNRVGYFRVLRSQLDLTDADGNTTTLEVTSLISWRGQWYVVHLNGFE